MAEPNSNRNLHLTLIYLTLALFWGGSFIAIKVAVGDLPPWLAAAGRLGLAVTFFTILLKVRGTKTHLPMYLLPRVWLTGIFTIGLPMLLLFWGARQISAGLAGIINGTVPLWTTFFLFTLFSKNKPDSNQRGILIGLILGFTGIGVIFYPKLAFQNHSNELLGSLSVLAMAVSYAAGNIMNLNLMKKHKELDIQTSVYHQQLVSFLFLLAFSFSFEQWPAIEEIPNFWLTFGALLYLGAISTTIANIMYFYLIREVGSLKTSTVTYWVPVVALKLDFLVFGTHPSPWALAGVLFIMSGMFLIFRKNLMK